MIRILLCCEGATDQGGKEYIDGHYINAEGAMQNLIRNTSKLKDMSFITKQRQDIKKIVLFGGKYHNHSTVSRKLAQLAKQENCTHIAYHQDEDNKGLSKIYNQVTEYFSAAKEKNIACLAIVPQHMIESWLLSDANAFQELFSVEPKNPALPVKPEEIWGNKGTANHPKKYLEQVLSQYHVSISPEIYAELAEHSDIEIMKKRCPKSFEKKFYSDIQSFICNGEEPMHINTDQAKEWY